MKLNIGSGYVAGSKFEGNGWECVDDAYTPGTEEWRGPSVYHKFNLTEAWPLPREVADCIFASHILEHIEHVKQRKVYEEAYRVLKPGAPMRIICPDPRIFFANWQAKNMQFILDCYGPDNAKLYGYMDDPAMAFTDMFFSDHYDHLLAPSIDMVQMFLVRAGFSKVTEMRYCNTEFPQFFGDYEHTLDNRPVMSYYLEAVK